MVATVAGIHLGIDTHSNRPAANTVPDGSIYSCSTHSLIYKSNYGGNSWATWATLGSGFANPMTTKGDVILGDTSGVATRLGAGTSGYVLTSNGAAAFPSWQAASGGGGITRSTLGTTSAGSSFLTTRGTYVKKVTLASAGELSSIHAFVKGNSTYIEMTAVLYTDSSGPTNMLSVPVPSTTSGGVTLTSMELNTTVRDMSMPIGRWLVAGDYWIGINDYNGTAGLSLAYNSGTGGDYQLALADVPYDSSISAFSSTSNDWCIYADILR